MEKSYFSLDFEIEKTLIKILSRSSKLVTGSKQKLYIDQENEIKQKWTNIFICYFLLPRQSVIDCQILYKTVISRYFLLNVVYFWLCDHTFSFKFGQKGFWMKLRLKIGPLWAQNASWHHFIHYHSWKWPKLVANLVKTSYKTLW